MATPGSDPKSRPALILAAAKELFYERSFSAVGVDELGERAGVTGPAIYRHFRGKDEILATLFDDAIDRLNEATAGQFDDPFEELEALARGHAVFTLQERKLAGVKIREERSLANPYRRRLHRRERRYIDRWTACMQRCYPDRDPARIAVSVYVALGALNSVATWSPDILRDGDIADWIVESVLRGLHCFDPVAIDS
jgi:AcrR family transcriptional regulator